MFVFLVQYEEPHHASLCTDHKVIKDETLNILLAGRDTTACTLTFSVFALAEHPAVLERLRKEVLDVVGPTHRPTYEHIREMKYMRAFINEVLRLYPPVYAIFSSVFLCVVLTKFAHSPLNSRLVL